MDWRQAERVLIDAFRILGHTPRMRNEWPKNIEHNGEWFVAAGPSLNISQLARELAALTEGK